MKILRLLLLGLVFFSCQRGNGLMNQLNTLTTGMGMTDESIKEISNEVDQIIERLKKKDKEYIYQMFVDEVKKVQTKNDMNKIFSYFDQYYGRLIEYKRRTLNFQNSMGYGKVGVASYGVKYEKCEGTFTINFQIKEDNMIKIIGVQPVINDYTQIPEFDVFLSPLMDALKKRDKKAIYNLTTAKYKSYLSITQFESNMDELLVNNFENLKLCNHQIGVIKGSGIIGVNLELADKSAYLQVLFVDTKDGFRIESMDLLKN